MTVASNEGIQLTIKSSTDNVTSHRFDQNNRVGILLDFNCEQSSSILYSVIDCFSNLINVQKN